MHIFTHLFKKYGYIAIFIAGLSIQSITIHSATIIVESEDDSGANTLREALDNAVDDDTIVFAPNVQLIKLLTPLPEITQKNLTIDGLATVMESTVIPGDCTAFPSPIDSQELFSDELHVTIDGSTIPEETPDRGICLDVQADNVTIRGLRIQNFNGRVATLGTQSSDAVGIRTSTSIETFTTIECCEIKNIISKRTKTQFDITIGSAFGIEVARSVDKCFIHNISSASEFSPNVRFIGSTSGVHNCPRVSNCLIKNIARGSCSSTLLELVEIAAGISIQEISQNSSNVTMQNCIIQEVHGGTTEVFDSSSNPTIENVSGVFIGTSSKDQGINIQNTTCCDVNAGTIAIDSIDETITALSTQGIFVQNTNNATITNNCITCISGYNIELSGENNTIVYSETSGINSAAATTVTNSNTIKSINGQTLTINGANNKAFIPSTNISINCAPYVPFSVIGIYIKNTLEKQTNIVSNNTIQDVGNSTQFVHGTQSLLLASGSAGINVQNNAQFLLDTNSVVTNNKIMSITGASYTITSDNSQILQLNGTSGISTESFKTRVSENIIENVKEGLVRKLSNNPIVLYALPLVNSLPFTPLPSEEIPFLSVYTNGITATGSLGITDTNRDAMNINSNIVKEVKGSRLQGNSQSLLSYAAGIIAKPSLSQVSQEVFKQLPQCDSNIGSITGNDINTIKADLNAASYGIVVDGTNVLILSAIESQREPVVNSKLLVQENSINSIFGMGNASTVALSTTGTTLIPFLPLEPTSGIFSLFGGCSTLQSNIISDVTAPITRGITTVASSNIEITGNTIFKTNGPGFFVGGASANPILINNSIVFDQQEFADFFPSVRNKIYSNSTYANTKKGIELGTINWNNFFTAVPLLQCEPLILKEPKERTKGGPIEIEIIGNHNQPAPIITRVVCNNNGTITIKTKFSDQEHPNSTFTIQFFRNNTNGISHGEELISNFENTQFRFITNESGNARNSFTFVPAHKVEPTDIISAHVTLTVDGSTGSSGSESSDLGDTSEFTMETTARKNPAHHLQKNSSASTPFCHRKN